MRLPASISNLGPGFDVLAMAIDLHVEVVAEPAERPRWTFTGLASEHLAAAPNPLNVLPMRGVVTNAIPVGVGLGSSAAAKVAALLLQATPRPGLLAAASRAEGGHPDNVAAVIHGGLVAVVGGRVHRLPTPDLEVALAVAADAFPTERSLAVLPERVPFGDVAFTAGRVGLFVHAVHTRGWELLREALDDRLHQPRRFRLYPWVPAVIEAALGAGAHGSALAGAGPSVFALCAPGAGARVAEAMAAASGGRATPMVTSIVDEGFSTARAAARDGRSDMASLTAGREWR